MKQFTLDGPYSDERGNRIIVNDKTILKNIKATIKGSNNTFIISDEISDLRDITIDMPSDEGVCVLGNISGVKQLKGLIRVGYKSLISIGDNVTSTNGVFISTAEQTQMIIGDLCMFASQNHIRTDDGHAIYDVVSGNRINKSSNIFIGAHNWISISAKIFGGSSIGDGSIIGMDSIVKGKFPNNCTIAGTPAKIVRRNVTWERPTLFGHRPWMKDHASQINKTEAFWNITDDYQKTPKMGNGLQKNIALLKKYCPDSLWLNELNEKFPTLQS